MPTTHVTQIAYNDGVFPHRMTALTEDPLLFEDDVELWLLETRGLRREEYGQLQWDYLGSYQGEPKDWTGSQLVPKG